MKFIMIVLITSCEPNRAFSSPGIAPHAAPAAIAAAKHSGTSTTRRQRSEHDADPGRGERGDVELPFRADVQQAGTERDRHREAGEDQRRRQKQRVADAVGPPERAADEQPVGLDRVVADRKDEHAADEERSEDGDERKQQIATSSSAARHQQADRLPVLATPDRLRRRCGRRESPAADRRATSLLRARPRRAAPRSRRRAAPRACGG